LGSLLHLISTFHERPYARPTNEKSICRQNLSIPKAIFAQFLIVKIALSTYKRGFSKTDEKQDYQT
jgi:hypothetical protein